MRVRAKNMNPRPQEQRGKNTEDFVSSFRSTLHRLVVPLNAKGKETLISLEGTSCSASWSGQEVGHTPF